MNPQKNNMSVLAQISSWIPDRIADNFAKKYKIQTRSFSPFSHVLAMVYAHLAHSLSLNDLCDDLRNHAGTLSQIRSCTPPSRNGLSHANRTRNADMAEELFWAVYESLTKRHPEFLTSSRNYPGLPQRFRKSTIRAVDFAGNESAIVAGDAFTVSGFKPYTVEYSPDNFEHIITFAVTTPSLDAFRMPTGTYQMRVKQDGSSEWLIGDPIVAPETDIEPQLIKSDADSNADVFFVNSIGTWESAYLAQHVGSTTDTWGGTKEYATLFGKNKLADIIEGSDDANILLMTDDDNGDALFVDDIYSALPGSVTEQQSRIAQIDEIRAGFGNDIVDMTSQQFEYVGDGLTIRGGDGNDVLWANKGDNWLFGDAGNDRIVGASGNDVIAGGIGNDRMHGGGGDDVFTFCDNWGIDTVEQLETGMVTLWFASGSIDNWDGKTLTYSDGDNKVTVSGVSKEQITLKFGDDGSDQFASLTSMGAFFDATTERIFEESGRGILASL